MIFVWGTRPTRRRVGYVADFCPLCRQAREFEVVRLGMVSHVYYISFGAGKFVELQRVCLACGTALSADDTRYKTIRKQHAPLLQLTSETFPTLSEFWKDRLAIENALRRTPADVPPEQRSALLREPFELLSDRVAEHFTQMRLDKEVAIALAGGALAIFAVAQLAKAFLPDELEMAVLVTFVLAGVAVLVALATAGGRFLDRQIAPLLAGALAPLKPTQAELSAILKELKASRVAIGKRLKMRHLGRLFAAPGRAVRAG